MGPVFRAYEPGRDRLVAIKLYRFDLAPERVHALVAAFERLIAAGVSSPGIAAPLAAGIARNAPYLVSEYVAADSLDVVVRDNGAAPPADAVRLVLQLAAALDAAAAAGVRHGALHPRDVLLSPEDSRITGIGVAQSLEGIGVAVPVRRPHTAPERIAGAVWDRRADVFSLAALTHELLWGRRIAGTGAAAADGLTEVTGANLARLRDLFAAALADDPTDRFGTALEFAEALQAAFPTVEHAAHPVDPAAEAVERSATPPERSAEPPGRSATPPERSAKPAERSAKPPERSAKPPERRAKKPERVDPVVLEFDETEIRRAEDARFQDVESAPAIVPFLESRDALADATEDEPSNRAALLRDVELTTPTVPSGLLLGADEASESALERSRSAVWPLALALVVGVALGFGIGYTVGGRDRAVSRATPPVPLSPDAVATGGREFTESAVTEPLKTPQAPVSPSPAAAIADTGQKPPAPAPLGLAPSATADESAGVLIVRSKPSGARVFVDGRDRGRTPATIHDLARGTHRVRIVHEGYATEERRVLITAAHATPPVAVALARTAPARPAPRLASATGAGSIAVESRPAGAKVFVDDKLVGSTPLVVATVAAGPHVVRLEREGYRRWSSPVRVVPGERHRVAASLER